MLIQKTKLPVIIFLLFLLLLLSCPHAQEKERGIRICDLRFIRRDLQLIELLIENKLPVN
jgi:hypothetical protein